MSNSGPKVSWGRFSSAPCIEVIDEFTKDDSHQWQSLKSDIRMSYQPKADMKRTPPLE
jgi:hypothetical protein